MLYLVFFESRYLNLQQNHTMNQDHPIQRFQYEDIGSKTISYLAEGLYPDARDPIREYIQNAVDANATNVALSISDDSIIIENNGNGMDINDLWLSLRIALSEKDPEKNVGYKGIGIYSGLLISKQMVIYSRKQGMCTLLTMDFNRMREMMETDKSLPEVINETTTVESIDDFEFVDETMGGDGTQVVLKGIRTELKELYTKRQLSEYLTNSLPLSFNPNFCYAEDIDKKIQKICDSTGYVYRSIPLHLTIDGKRDTLYRPYKFNTKQLFEPDYQFVKLNVNGKETIFALVWGCLNKQRKRLGENQRGFRFKQKGFSIGDSETVLPYFTHAGKHAYRYIGEIVIFSHHIRANTARSNIAHTEYFFDFRRNLKRIVSKYERKSNEFQESSMALKKCNEVENELNELVKSPNPDRIFKLQNALQSLKIRLKRQLDKNSKSRVMQLIQNLETVIPELTRRLDDTQNTDSSEPPTDPRQTGNSGANNDTIYEEGTQTSDAGHESHPPKTLGLPTSDEVVSILEQLNKAGSSSAPQVRKIQQLYRSLRTISINQHSCLAYIGTWALWEIIAKTLSPNIDRNPLSYLTDTVVETNERLGKSYKNKDYMESLKHIHSEGNMNKHSDTAVAETPKLLKNKMEVLEDFLLEMTKEIYKKFIGIPWNK